MNRRKIIPTPRPLWLPPIGISDAVRWRCPRHGGMNRWFNMGIYCCCQPFACEEDLVECGRIKNYVGTLFGDVYAWLAGITTCGPSDFVDDGRAKWDGVFNVYAVGPPASWSTAADQWYAVTYPGGGSTRMWTLTGAIGCVAAVGDVPGYWFVRVSFFASVVFNFTHMYWTKSTGNTKEGVYTFNAALSQSTDVSCYIPIPATLQIENC